MPDQECLTVRQLIAVLEKLSEEDKDKLVHCFAEAGCVSTEVYGIAKVAYDAVYLDGC